MNISVFDATTCQSLAVRFVSSETEIRRYFRRLALACKKTSLDAILEKNNLNVGPVQEFMWYPSSGFFSLVGCVCVCVLVCAVFLSAQ